MKRQALLILLLALVTAGGCVTTAPEPAVAGDEVRGLAEEGPVSVRWTDPEAFSEIRYSGNRVESRRGNWLPTLGAHLRTRAESRLAPGQTLEVTFTDIDLAGDYEPWRGPNADRIRQVRDIYPPRIELHFRLLDAQGRTLSEGERRLSDPAFLHSGSLPGNSDPLRHEKRLLDRWLQREFPR